MNNVNLIGRLTADPTLHQAQNGNSYAAVTIALDRGKDKDGNDRGADFPRVYMYGRTAENVCKYMKKGSQVGISGHIRTGSYEKDGQTHYTTDVIADRVQFLSKPQENDQQYTRTESAQTVPPQFQQNSNEYAPVGGFAAIADDDIPF